MSALIVSDYDGTMKKNNKIEINYNLIKELINDNNKLMISTGRVYKSIKKEIDTYDIPFNYISCANGNVLINNRLEVINKTFVNEQIIKELKPFYNSIISMERNDEFGNEKKDKFTELFIHLENDNKIRRMLVDQLLNSKYYDYCSEGNNKFDIHIFNKVNKINTIDIVKRLLKISDNEIFTIGDGPNDIDMIQKYNGYMIDNNLETFNSCLEDIKKKVKK